LAISGRRTEASAFKFADGLADDIWCRDDWAKWGLSFSFRDWAMRLRIFWRDERKRFLATNLYE